jgi:4,5-DOPA dioxygenase extradiol
MSINAARGPAPILFIPHGGGPLPLLGEPGHQGMVDFLQAVTRQFERPEAIVVISAHWETAVPTITSGAAPGLIYDYFGFPEESYRITYPAPGAPELAASVAGMFSKAGIPAVLDDRRGFDHGVFVPLAIMYPDAGIPCIQVSILSSMDPEEHLRLGRALAGLRQKNVLVLGSGFSFHSLRAFFSPLPGGSDPRNDAFQDYLLEACTNALLTTQEREDLLRDWENAPSARYAQPREDHLMPLHVCAGMAGSAAKTVFDGPILGKRAIGLLWKG